MSWKRIIGLTTLVIWSASAFALGHNEQQCRANVSGTFSYYKLVVSRAKEWCFANLKTNDPQCSHEYVVHGLWPQCDAGYPSDCALASGSQEDSVDTRRLLQIMPSKSLIQHEWLKHGRCSGLKRSQYFSTLSSMYQGIHLPSLRSGKYTPAQLIDLITRDQPGLRAENIELACDENGRAAHASRTTLDEIRVCYGRDGKYTPCLEHETSCSRLPQIEVRF